MIEIKNLIRVLLVVAMVSLSVLCIAGVASSAVGPAPFSGDGVPSGNQEIQPDTPGVGPAPNAGDGIPDGSGF